MANPNPKNKFQKGKSGNPSGMAKGTRHYYSRLTNEQRQEIAKAANGLTPLELFLSVVRSEKEVPIDARIEAAKAAAPYMHRKMPIAIEGGDPSKPINILDIASMKDMSKKEIETLLALLAKAGATLA
jgi:hypothetical protein